MTRIQYLEEKVKKYDEMFTKLKSNLDPRNNPDYYKPESVGKTIAVLQIGTEGIEEIEKKYKQQTHRIKR